MLINNLIFKRVCVCGGGGILKEQFTKNLKLLKNASLSGYPRC